MSIHGNPSLKPVLYINTPEIYKRMFFCVEKEKPEGLSLFK